ADGAARAVPARAVLRHTAGVEAPAVDHHEGVAGVRVDRDVAAAAGGAVGHQRRGVELAVEQPTAVQSVGDRAGAVVAPVVPRAVAAAPLVGLVLDAVARGDHAADDGGAADHAAAGGAAQV